MRMGDAHDIAAPLVPPPCLKKAAIVFSVGVLLAGCAGRNLPEASADGASPNAASPRSAVRTLRVGPGEPYKQPGAAAAKALRGDTIVIDGGHYACAVWNADDLAIVADGDVVIEGAVCEDKGLFVINGRNATVRGITFRGAKSSAGNGAGIREHGETLTVENSTFLDNQNGILAATAKRGTVTIRNSRFEGNGTCIEEKLGCAHGVYIAAGLLRIENSTFLRQLEGHHIKSRSERTELVGNTIEDGADGTSSYLVDLPDGGSLAMRNNVLEKGVKSQNDTCAITIGEESTRHPTAEIVLENNRFENDLPKPVLFLRNRTNVAPQLSGNVFRGPVIPVGAPGA
jgi:hypothetical protein